MKFYDAHVLPRLTHLAMRQAQLRPYREQVVSAAHGRVLEIGIGSGLNLPLYPPAVDEIVGVDPSPGLLHLATDRRGPGSVVDLVEAVAENLPFEDDSFDCVVVSWALCSVSSPEQALAEIRRVLRPSGLLSFVEHGLAPEKRVREWQRWLTPLWRRCAGNCHLDRPTATLIGQGGFRLEDLHTGYAHGPKPMTFMYQGLARKR
ncbi:MAG: class I SAM-dependent methyltransferase [Pseudomonadota bacterium]